ncbi:MAG: hypothetical protein HOQ44_01200 [Nocardia sp.]|nr:hypothetical protein [Nocardia sp.]
MPTDPDRDGKHGALAIGALLLVPALCCGLPLLIAGGLLAGLGSVLGNPWVIGAAVALVVAVVVWRVRRHARATRSAASACCAPEPPGGERSSGPATESPTRHQQQ